MALIRPGTPPSLQLAAASALAQKVATLEQRYNRLADDAGSLYKDLKTLRAEMDLDAAATDGDRAWIDYRIARVAERAGAAEIAVSTVVEGQSG